MTRRGAASSCCSGGRRISASSCWRSISRRVPAGNCCGWRRRHRDRRRRAADGASSRSPSTAWVPPATESPRARPAGVRAAALPGERWRVRLERRQRAGRRRRSLVWPSAERDVPPCPHFGRCGGCRLQHLPPDLYAAHKRQRIVDALAHRGLADACVGELLVRRRRAGGGCGWASDARPAVGGGSACASVGHRSSRSSVPDRLPRAGGASAGARGGVGRRLERPDPTEASLTLTEAGLDLLLHADRSPRPAEREHLAAHGRRAGSGTSSWATGDGTPEPIVTRRLPVVRLGAVPVALPPGAFLQASGFADEAAGRSVEEWAQGARHAVDLFAGIGTLTFALARRVRRVRACRGRRGVARGAAAGGRRRAAGGVSVERRDLTRRPLTAGRAQGLDLVVLDPPRGGAAEQVRQLAAAPDPPRDLRLLLARELCPRRARAGRRRPVRWPCRPIDQFLYAAEVELVARFVREARAQNGLDPPVAAAMYPAPAAVPFV